MAPTHSLHACMALSPSPHLQVDPVVLKAVQTACKLYNVRNVDLWSNLLVRASASCVHTIAHDCVGRWGQSGVGAVAGAGEEVVGGKGGSGGVEGVL